MFTTTLYLTPDVKAMATKKVLGTYKYTYTKWHRAKWKTCFRATLGFELLTQAKETLLSSVLSDGPRMANRDVQYFPNEE